MSADLQGLFVEVWETVEEGRLPAGLTGRAIYAAAMVEMCKSHGYDPELDMRVNYLRLAYRCARRLRTPIGDDLHEAVRFLTGEVADSMTR